jgi:hypothetical protein
MDGIQVDTVVAAVNEVLDRARDRGAIPDC